MGSRLTESEHSIMILLLHESDHPVSFEDIARKALGHITLAGNVGVVCRGHVYNIRRKGLWVGSAWGYGFYVGNWQEPVGWRKQPTSRYSRGRKRPPVEHPRTCPYCGSEFTVSREGVGGRLHSYCELHRKPYYRNLVYRGVTAKPYA